LISGKLENLGKNFEKLEQAKTESENHLYTLLSEQKQKYEHEKAIMLEKGEKLFNLKVETENKLQILQTEKSTLLGKKHFSLFSYFSENIQNIQQEKEEIENQMQSHIMEIQQKLDQVEQDRNLAISKVERYQAIKGEVEARLLQFHEQNSSLTQSKKIVFFHVLTFSRKSRIVPSEGGVRGSVAGNNASEISVRGREKIGNEKIKVTRYYKLRLRLQGIGFFEA
jgi:hypothetical protein